MVRVTVTVGYSVDERGNKKQIQKSFYGKTKAEANRKKKEWEERGRKQTRNTDGANILFDTWVYEVLANDGGLAISTRKRYIEVYELYLKDAPFLFAEANDITALEIQGFFNKLNATYSPKRIALRVLKRFFRYLELNGQATNKAEAVVIAKDTFVEAGENIIVWSDEEVNKLLSPKRKTDSRSRISFLVTLLYYTGLRIGEAMALKQEDFDLDTHTLSVNKQVVTESELVRGKKKQVVTLGKLKTRNAYRTIPLSDELVLRYLDHLEWQKEDMKKHGYNTDFIFTTKKGKLYEKPALRRALMRYCYRVGVPYKSFHAFRHTFATKMAAVTPMKDVSALLGHSDISVTAKYYVKADAERIKNAVNSL